MSAPFNASQILTEFGSSSKTGCLSVKSQGIQWKIFIRRGELQYADCSTKDLSQLQYSFVKHGWNEAQQILKKLPKDHNNSEESKSEFEQAMAWIWLHKGLDITQIKQLIQDITLDAIETFFWLKEGITEWHEKESLPTWIQASEAETTGVSLGQTIQYLHQRLHGWYNTPEELNSPHQRPYILDERDIGKPVEKGTLSPEAFRQLAGLLSRGLSVRQLSLYLKRDEIQVAKLLAPYIEGKVIHLRLPRPPFDQLPNILRDNNFLFEKQEKKPSKVHKIVCIDDNPIILSEIKRFLNNEEYEVTAIDDPVKASSIIFKLKPDLILLDITMPKINGYNLCSLLRNSTMLHSTPIIMVSGNTGLIDKARAKLCGATGYLSKPFTQKELQDITHKYLAS